MFFLLYGRPAAHDQHPKLTCSFIYMPFIFNCFASFDNSRRVAVVASNVSTECWVVSIPENAASLTADSAEIEEFVIEEPDDEKYFTMVDKGK